ncbi:MAG: DUF86 domain-containing protein [Clostridia bacterium]|nr:DUF86 domain-containing protein [Clostridia bacterium]
MKDKTIICKKLDALIGYYKELKDFSAIPIDEYMKNTLVRRAIERQLQLIVECATDINNMILKRLRNSPSKDYFNSFIDLAEENILSHEFALKIAPSTGMRNIIVHQYQKVNDEIVYKSIDSTLLHYKVYIEEINKYLKCD